MTEASTHLLTEHGDVLENSEPLYRVFCLSRTFLRIGRVHYCEEETDKSKDADWSKSSRHMLHGLTGPERHGTCSSLPVLLVAVARRLDYPMKLVQSPGHFFARWDGLQSPINNWRERRNIEFSGDFDTYPDERYHERPVKWTQDTFEREQLRHPLPLYLRSLMPSEELASFLVQRGHALEAHEMFVEAMDAYIAACKLAPHNDIYLCFSKECNRKQLDHTLAPWQLSARQFQAIIEQRLSGRKVSFPWDVSQVASNQNTNPLLNPRTGPVLIAAQQAIADRIAGRGKLPPAMQYMLEPAIPKPAQVEVHFPPIEMVAPTEMIDELFSSDLTDLFETCSNNSKRRT